MTTNKVQFRGHCQCCGNLQAVLPSGRMSKHGYTVQHGWFEGVCSGQKFQPMEHDRCTTDKIVSDVRADVAKLLKQAKGLRDGKVFPKECKSGQRVRKEDPKRPGRFNFEDEYVPFAQGAKHYQDQAVDIACNKLGYRANQGESFAAYLESVVNAVHGKELIKVEKQAPSPILPGEKRLNGSGKVLTAKYQQGARVYCTFEREDGKVLTSWYGVQAWRKLQPA